METVRLHEAAAALSEVLEARGIPHAFHGNILVSLLSRSATSSVCSIITTHPLDGSHSLQEILCIVEGSAGAHPFGRVRQAVEGSGVLTATNQPHTNR